MTKKNLSIPELVRNKLEKYQISAQPFLLALSGGSDSLALFYALIACQSQLSFTFHVAHVDHGWRPESQREAEQLEKLCRQYHIPFYLHRLECHLLQGNLEQACRQERLRFFDELCKQKNFQAVLLAHHQNDQVETVLKRVFEGAHWSCFAGLVEEILVDNMRLLRPLLDVSKNELLNYLEELKVTPVEDSTNYDQRFMRARMRQTILPWLNQTFGKNVQSSLIKLAKDMQEIDPYFKDKVERYLEMIISGPFGLYLDLAQASFSSDLEFKYFVRAFCKRYQIDFSREQIELCAKALHQEKTNQIFEVLGKKLYIDRKCLFLFKDEQARKGKWVSFCHEVIQGDIKPSCWKIGWLGECQVVLEAADYEFVERNCAEINCKSLNKWWTNHAVPACLRDLFPLVCYQKGIVHEFLTGKCFLQKESKKEKIKITMRYLLE